MLPTIAIKPVSSLENCFLDQHLADKPTRDSFLMFRNEKLSFQLLCENLDSVEARVPHVTPEISGPLAPYVRVREMVCMPVHNPVCPQCCDEDYLRTTPGLYPNLLRPLRYVGMDGNKTGYIRLQKGQLRSLWIDVQIPEDAKIPTEETTLSFKLHATTRSHGSGCVASCDVKIRVSPVALPPQKLIRTEWFYCDCIARAHRTRVFSERHWSLIEKYLRVAVDNGVNMILTPVFTPELDTYIGGERPTTQLVGITVEDDGSYSFDFSLLDRWIDLCLRLGVKYFEIPHFFTQWGANHAPKFVATVKGKKQRIFGWETDAMGSAYRDFLAQLLPALVSHFKARGIDKNCFYHISDEPKLADLDHYLACKELVAPYLQGYPIIDALSDFDFYEKGVLRKPVPAIKHAHKFLEHQIEGLWVYYCGASGKVETTDRYLAMPLSRTRMLGVQLYRHRIEGFLHWGYNFYYNQNSYEYVDPLACTDGDYFAPAGDTCLVFPDTENDEVLESLRLNAMREAMDDLRALQLCESLLGRDATEALIHQDTQEPLTFYTYPRRDCYLPALRDRILLAVEQAQA